MKIKTNRELEIEARALLVFFAVLTGTIICNAEMRRAKFDAMFGKAEQSQQVKPPALKPVAPRL